MNEIATGAIVRIIDGMFSGLEAVVKEVAKVDIKVEVEIFDRPTLIDVRRDQVEHSGGDLRSRCRSQIAEDFDDGLESMLGNWWIERSNTPEANLAADWKEFEEFHSIAKSDVSINLQELLSDFDNFRDSISEEDIEYFQVRWAEQETRWKPNRARWIEETKWVREGLRSDDPGKRSAAESELNVFGERKERGMVRRRSARKAAVERAYAEWQAAQQTADTQTRSAAFVRVEQGRAAVEERISREWGIELPDSIFRFQAFLLSLGPVEKQALGDSGVSPMGIMDLLNDPTRVTRDGIDIRVHDRYYQDPPEFLTFMHGGSDGLHFGLWYDDGRTCAGVCSYYNNDGGGVGLPCGTPLQALREHIESRWELLECEDSQSPDVPLIRAQLEDRFRLRALRHALMAFETGDRPEEGEAYAQAHGISQELLKHGDPHRFETLDGGGALVAGKPSIARCPQRPYDDSDFHSKVETEILSDPAALQAYAEEARRRCAAGDAADALTLGRDLHWESNRDPERERLAHELLVLAYRSLGRDNLAAITDAHYRHRHLPQVGALQLPKAI
ncbi:ADP-ribosylation family protein [Streptomyces sp. NBC_00233]|uniref:ADP-ribosylation family protein n=1 Tax=Streptomyces sp. NBC_00233 TaxID=2975686 RepID=UPI00224CD54A|nr:ADP-ribosylation family protein [Streptomyces sp. NBC_00233]MCX5233446.1 DUF2228 domain-containing protein [Streptomyces sp. NBC_00233]